MNLDTSLRLARARMAKRAGATAAAVLIVASTVTALTPSTHAAASSAKSGSRSLGASSFKQTWSTGALPDLGQPIALSSPVPADLDGQAAMVVGDRRGFLYAYHLSNGTTVAGWPTTNGSGPVDSTPSVDSSGGSSTVLVGSGNDADPTTGGYTAFDPQRDADWFTQVVNPPSDSAPLLGVEAGISIGALQGGTGAVAGSLGQVSYALDASTGAALTGWPFFNSDSTHSTAALADLYGTGQNEIIVGGDQSAGAGKGQSYTDGGHLRILSAQGDQICRADTDQVVDSSPAVGGFLAGGATGIVVGTGLVLPRRLGHRHGDGLQRALPAAVVDQTRRSTYSSPGPVRRDGQRIAPGGGGDRPGDRQVGLGVGAERGHRADHLEGRRTWAGSSARW